MVTFKCKCKNKKKKKKYVYRLSDDLYFARTKAKFGGSFLGSDCFEISTHVSFLHIYFNTTNSRKSDRFSLKS